jgi:uncharacterized protein (TIGR00255 family)
MTGFGRGVAEHGGVRATVDLRSVNHRFVDLKLRAQVAPVLEDAIGARIRGALERGAVTVSIHLDRDGAGGVQRVDFAAARTVHAELTALAGDLGIAGPDLKLVLAQPGVMVASAADPDAEPDVAIVAALDVAIRQLVEMRAVEGGALATELGQRLGELAQLRAKMQALAGAVPAQVQRRLHERLQRLLGDDAPPDPARVAQELALLADRADITEELVRLGSHLEQAAALIAGTGASGRRLDFLVQEIGRELNTIGSKSQHTEITGAIVEAKAVLEKVREQVQNVE